MRAATWLLAAASLCATCHSIVIPEALKICYRDDPYINDCLKESLQHAMKSLANGLPEFGLPPLDPRVEKELKIEYKRNQISGKGVMNDLIGYGFSKSIVHNVRVNLQDDFFDLEADLSSDQIDFEGHFQGEGRLNALIFNTKGFYNNTMSDVTWTWKIHGEPQVRNGKTYMKIKKFFMRPEVGNMVVRLTNIFEDNPQLSKIAQDFAQNYWKVIYHELLPVVEQTWNKIGIKLCNKIFLKIPYDEMFPMSS